MFKNTQVVKLTLDGDGKPTAIASTEEKALVPGVLAHFTSALSADTAVIGIGRTIGHALEIYAPMVLTNFKLTGGLRFNPFQAR